MNLPVSEYILIKDPSYIEVQTWQDTQDVYIEIDDYVGIRLTHKQLFEIQAKIIGVLKC